MHHLSTKLFSQDFADFEGEEKMQFKNTKPALIVFHTGKDNFADGFKEIYYKLSIDNEMLTVYDVLVNEYPEIPKSYRITAFPATMFVPAGGKPIIVQGYTTCKEAIKDLKEYILTT